MPALTLDQPLMWVIALASAVVAGFVRGFTGFGGPAVMTLVLVQLYDPISVLPKVIVIDAVSNLKLLPNTRHEVDWRIAGVLVATGVLAAPAGFLALLDLDPIAAKWSIALVTAIATLALMTGWRFKLEPPLWAYAVAGLAAGLALGATYIALPLVAFLLASPASSATTRANTVYWAFSMGVLLIVVHIVGGTLGAADLLRSSVVGVAYLIGAVAGTAVFRRAGERSFRRAVLWLLLVLSVTALLGN